MGIEFKHNALSEKIVGLIPSLEAATKTLKIQAVSKNSNARKLVVSTNWLNIFGFNKGESVVENVIGCLQGLEVTKATSKDTKTKLVYSRSYKNRDDETQMDIRSQAKLNKGLGDAVEAHILFTKDRLIISPVFAPENKAIATGLNITLGEKGISFVAIIDALNTIRDQKFAKLVIDTDSDYETSHEFTLFLMSVRRMGYSLEKSDDGKLVAVLGDGATSSMIEYEHSPTYKIKDAAFDHSDPLSTISVCTSGVDIHSIEKEGFNVHTCVDFRPIEERDVKKTIDATTGEIIRTLKSDKTESGAICAAVNSKAMRLVLNEDIYKLDLDRVAGFFKHVNFFQASLTCTDFSNLKNLADKLRHIESLKSTADMFIPMLGLIEKIDPPTLQIENVVPFASSLECELFCERLRLCGYDVYVEVLQAEDFNCYTKRPRCYIFATKLNAGFEWPKPIDRTAHVWNDIIKPNSHLMRDITHSNSVQKGVTTGRIRPILEGDHIAPTVLKSASRITKDGVYPRIGDRYFMPSNEMFKMMMGIDEGFDLSLFSNELGTEIIGQSIECKMHSHISLSIKNHIMNYVNRAAGIVKKAASALDCSGEARAEQLNLFT